LQYLTNQFQFFLAHLTTIGLKSIHKKFLEIQYISYDQFCVLLFEWLPSYMHGFAPSFVNYKMGALDS
jgi:hypothetical protein